MHLVEIQFYCMSKTYCTISTMDSPTVFLQYSLSSANVAILIVSGCLRTWIGRDVCAHELPEPVFSLFSLRLFMNVYVLCSSCLLIFLKFRMHTLKSSLLPWRFSAVWIESLRLSARRWMTEALRQQIIAEWLGWRWIKLHAAGKRCLKKKMH